MSDLWWTLIKRQTELGEFQGFEDERFSSYGPITEYHGTAFAPEIDRGGLQGNVMSPHRAVRPPANMEGKPVVYTTTDKKLAQQWGEQQTKRQNKFGKEKRKPRVVAVRGQGLDYTPDPKQDAKSSFQQGEVRVRTPNIPRERLVVRKEAKSPKALAHKRKYETQYESSPARKKYRRELERERRKRGVAGKGGKDMSHTKRGTIVPEDPHANRARSHPSVGSTLKMVRIIKSPLYDTATGKQVAGVPTPMPSKDNLRFENNMDFDFDFSNHGPVQPNERFLYQSPDQKVRAIVESRGKHASIPLFATHDQERGKGRGRQALRDIRSELRTIHPDVEHIEPTGVTVEAEPFWEKMNDERLISYDAEIPPIPNIDKETGEPFERGEPMDIAMRLLKEQKKLFVQGQKTLDGQPAFMPTDFAAEEQRRQATLKEQRAREAREAQRRKNAEGLTPLPRFQQNSE